MGWKWDERRRDWKGGRASALIEGGSGGNGAGGGEALRTTK